ncbi:UDP-N-acetylmuramoyl-L-alanine--D-glutamate ligase [Leucothrix mucor]|uniref:UDP-N-acetylmuramoyl-L-alanine--D-glutamate ligase n=1 Tax=Leucothrix mucor TaxID=45248 RepID=UPI0003B5C32B|nr:UDP-N-acetylmuramoyl-L-alanine--D-glutamate ligase [Leucothrix mucor]
MQQATQVNWHTLIVGLGKTGLSVARYLSAQGIDFAVMDSRETPPSADVLAKDFPDVPSYYGKFDADIMCQAKLLVINPGIALATPEIEKARSLGIEVVGDVELFAREAEAPILAVTGSNGKTTVASLLDCMAKAAGIRVATGGNIGLPALALLEQKNVELYVLELSSFQLETTSNLHCRAACILNITEDHLNRYANRIELYAAAKARIYDHCDIKVVNRDDERVMAMAKGGGVVSFGFDAPEQGQYGLISEGDQLFLARGREKLLKSADVKLPGRHNLVNALAALALANAAGIPLKPCLEVLKTFEGLEHRTQWVGENNGIHWYNDSKGTNVGATVAALHGLNGKTVLLAGGQGKAADFTPLADAVQKYARAVVLFGEDAELIALSIKGDIPIVFATDMLDAVEQAKLLAQIGDNVLLSPACASFDMFDSYEHRGRVFVEAVKQVVLC